MRSHFLAFGDFSDCRRRWCGFQPSWAVLQWQTAAWRRRLCPHRRHERLDADDVHDAREVAGQHVQRHLGGNPWQRLHQEVGCSHPGLDRSEGMLNRLAPFAHLFRMFVEPALHRLENVLMLPSGDPSFLASGAAVLDAAALAGFGRVAAQDQSIFRGGEGVGKPFTGRTDVNVIFSYITEVLLAEAPFRLCVRGHWLWSVSYTHMTLST